jgi:hypothetical protein
MYYSATRHQSKGFYWWGLLNFQAMRVCIEIVWRNREQGNFLLILEHVTGIKTRQCENSIAVALNTDTTKVSKIFPACKAPSDVALCGCTRIMDRTMSPKRLDVESQVTFSWTWWRCSVCPSTAPWRTFIRLRGMEGHGIQTGPAMGRS